MVEKLGHNQFRSEKLMEHIEDAKDWLDKAKEYYKQANPTHAEMTLNLAQAEVKHAWELSRERYVSKKKTTIPKRKFNHLIAVAASILVVLGIIFGYRQGEINKYLASIFIPVEENVFVDSGSKPAMTKNDQKVFEVENASKVQGELENPIEPVSRPAKSEETIEPQDSTTIAGDTKLKRSDSEGIQNTVRMRQASQFAIDEDALTQEASRSLRNGK
ncbi:MAG: hypothetical protein ACM3YE_02335 [Bacteroidota bacterium]